MSSGRRRKDHWQNAERHYCAICNAWMGSDRQSILLHENGKKHVENQERAMQDKRNKKKEEEQSQKSLIASLQQMERAALQSHLRQDSMISTSILAPAPVPSLHPTPQAIASSMPSAVPPPHEASRQSTKQEKENWKKRRKIREEDGEAGDATSDQSRQKRRKIEPDEGHYELDGKTFLEGPVFYEILEEEMPIQIWTGPLLASALEKKLPERDHYWKNAILVAVRGQKVHVAYLASLDDEQETVEKNVPVDRIRIILGADEKIPDTLAEARLMAMGGEEITVKQSSSSQVGPQVDDATGLSGWSTVAIKRTTVRQELKEERERIREQRRQTVEEKAAKEKEAEARKMEEAKVANADDSALGAYDVWGKGGYKGIDISNSGDKDLTVADTAKSLSAGKTSVGFKKVKKGMVNRGRRTTSADDD